jgi:hypothetical protein
MLDVTTGHKRRLEKAKMLYLRIVARCRMEDHERYEELGITDVNTTIKSIKKCSKAVVKNACKTNPEAALST